jgi:hypothetical protein
VAVRSGSFTRTERVKFLEENLKNEEQDETAKRQYALSLGNYVMKN